MVHVPSPEQAGEGLVGGFGETGDWLYFVIDMVTGKGQLKELKGEGRDFTFGLDIEWSTTVMNAE